MATPTPDSYGAPAGAVLKAGRTSPVQALGGGATAVATAVATLIAGAGPAFTIPVPTPLDTATFARTHISQPGSRIFYVDPVGGTNTSNTATTIAQAMFWNGSALVDASGSTTGAGGVPYGADPLNPSGPVNTVRTWQSVGPRTDGSDVGSITGSIAQENVSPSNWTRAGFADWILIKRGTTLSIDVDKTTWRAASGGSQTYGGMNLPRGKSTTERAVLGSWGPTSTVRPVITDPTTAYALFFGAWVAGANYQLYTGLTIDGGPRVAQPNPHAAQYLTAAQADADVNFEDCWFYRCDAEFQLGSGGTKEIGSDSSFAGSMTFVGCLFTDFWHTGGRVSGMYYGGQHYTGRPRLKSCVFIRNGHNEDPTTKTAFTPDGVEWSYGAYAAFGRNLYMSGGTDPNNSLIDDCVFILGGSGFQCRSGATITRNFFYEGYVGIGSASGYPPGTSDTWSVANNVLQRYKASGASGGALGCPGWGFIFGGGAYGINFTTNIFSQAQNATADASGIGFGLQLVPTYDDTDTPFNRATTNCTFSGNIFDVVYATADPPSAVEEVEGDSRADAQWAAPITGTWAVGQTLTCTPAPGYSGTPSFQWRKNGAAITGPTETSSTYVIRAGDLPNDPGIRCYVTGISYAGVTGVGLKNNAISNNVFSVTGSNTTRKSFYAPAGVTACNSTDTSYSGNRTYATVAAAAAAEGWSDANRTLKTYLQSIGISVSSADGAKEYYDAALTLRRGNWDARLTGAAIDNHIRAGRGLGAV